MARLRTFIAVELSDAIRDKAIALQVELSRSAADVKWVEPENIHVTLLFLGEVNDRDLPDVCRAASDSCSKLTAFSLCVAGVSCFGSPRRPRTLWIGVSEGSQELITLHDALEPPLLDLGCYRREGRQYTPHITLGRVKGDRSLDRLPNALARLANWRGGQMMVEEVLVLSSELTRDGPQYTVLSRAELSAAPEEE